MEEMNLKFTVDEINKLLTFFNQLPFGTTRGIVDVVLSFEQKVKDAVEQNKQPKVEIQPVSDYLDPNGADC